MKKNLGKIILIFILFSIDLQALELATYKLFANKKEAFIKEPVTITFIAKQTNHTDNMFFFLKPKKSLNYDIKLISKSAKDNKHNAIVTFIYVLFPLKNKQISINFDFIIKTASDKAVAQSYVDDHDNSVGIETQAKHIKISPLVITTKQTSKKIDLVGDFTLKAQIDKKQINQYEDLNLLYTLSGSGYQYKNLKLLKSIAGVTMFSDVHDEYSRLGEHGYSFKRVYTYSLSSKKSFFIPAISLRVYSPKKNLYYTLSTSSYNTVVKKIDVSTLLDKQEQPTTKDIVNLKDLKQFLIYLSIFLAGFFISKIPKLDIKKFKHNTKLKDIRGSSSPKELIMVLLKGYKDRDIKSYLYQLEMLEYKKSDKSFKDIKNSILKEFM